MNDTYCCLYTYVKLNSTAPKTETYRCSFDPELPWYKELASKAKEAASNIANTIETDSYCANGVFMKVVFSALSVGFASLFF